MNKSKSELMAPSAVLSIFIRIQNRCDRGTRFGPFTFWKCGCLLFVLLFLWASAADSAPPPDPRNFANGWPVPVENYCDQPRILATRYGTWICLLTTGPGSEGANGEHVVATSSEDKGKHWSPPMDIEAPDRTKPSAYAVGLITPEDRIYAFYCYNGDGIRAYPDGKPLPRADEQGWFCYRFSDDKGKTWSSRYRLPLRLTPVDFDNEWKGELQMFWAVGTPTIFEGKAIFGFTKLGQYIQEKGEGWFFRSDNILTERDPAKLNWQLLPDGDRGVRTPEFGSVQEEFDVIALEKEDLLSVYRTTRGVIGSSYSRDGGHTWSQPEPLRYNSSSPVMKNPRANPKLWKMANGRYLLWYHNDNASGYEVGSRNLVWLSAGQLKEGRILWSQPELLAYVDGGAKGCSYPDLIEDGGHCYVFSTQKSECRVMEIEAELLDGLWSQGSLKRISSLGLATNVQDCASITSVAAPKIAPLCGDLQHGASARTFNPGALTIEAVARFSDLAPGQILLDSRDDSGRGWVLRTSDHQNVRFEMCDGINAAYWDCDAGLLKANTPHQVAVVVDGFPKTICFVVDGVLCDGGVDRAYGYGRFSSNFKDISGGKVVRLAGHHGDLKQLRIYTRAVRISELVGNFLALQD